MNKTVCLKYAKPYTHKLATDRFQAVTSGTNILVKIRNESV